MMTPTTGMIIIRTTVSSVLWTSVLRFLPLVVPIPSIMAYKTNSLLAGYIYTF